MFASLSQALSATTANGAKYRTWLPLLDRSRILYCRGTGAIRIERKITDLERDELGPAQHRGIRDRQHRAIALLAQ